MVTKKSWDEFRETGLLLIINQILHIFGWVIVVVEDESNVIEVYPARVKFRGFGEKSTEDAYKKVSAYMIDHGSNDLQKRMARNCRLSACHIIAWRRYI